MQTLQSLQYLKSVPVPDCVGSVVLPPTEHRKVLIFDLDETLVHCVENIEQNPCDLPIVVNTGGETVTAGINVRPHAYECLKQARKHYQVVIFTASHSSYADVVLDTLEREFRKLDYLTEEERALYHQDPATLYQIKAS